jgi:hypothetical protein
VVCEAPPTGGWREGAWTAAYGGEKGAGDATPTTISSKTLVAPGSLTPYCLDASGGAATAASVGTSRASTFAATAHTVVAASVCYPTAAMPGNTDKAQQWLMRGDSTISPVTNSSLCLTAVTKQAPPARGR